MRERDRRAFLLAEVLLVLTPVTLDVLVISGGDGADESWILQWRSCHKLPAFTASNKWPVNDSLPVLQSKKSC